MGRGMLAEKDLTPPERRLLQAVGAGRMLELGADEEDPNDPAEGAGWPAHRTVRAELLVELLTGQRKPPGAPQARTLKLSGARITGTLDLEAATLACPLRLQDCYLEQPIRLREARAPAVRLPGCHLPGLEAGDLETHGILALNDGFTAHGEVNLVGARIGGQLYGDGAVLINPRGRALFADWLTANQGVHCHRLLARGEVRLPGARISGTVEFDAADLTGREPSNDDEHPVALTADGLRVEGSMFCRAGFTARGEVRLPGAQVGGELVFEGATLTNPGGWALTADGLSVTGTWSAAHPTPTKPYPPTDGSPPTARWRCRVPTSADSSPSRERVSPTRPDGRSPPTSSPSTRTCSSARASAPREKYG